MLKDTRCILKKLRLGLEFDMSYETGIWYFLYCHECSNCKRQKGKTLEAETLMIVPYAEKKNDIYGPMNWVVDFFFIAYPIQKAFTILQHY